MLISSKHYVKAKFVIVGIWNTIFGYGLFCLLDTFFSWLFSAGFAAYMTAMALSWVLAVTNAYICHKYITFKSDAKGRAIITEYLRFTMTYVATFVLGFVFLPVMVEVLHIPPKMSAAIITLICTVLSYLGHSKFSFR